MMGFSPCDLLFVCAALNQAFFRSLFSHAEKGPNNKGF